MEKQNEVLPTLLLEEPVYNDSRIPTRITERHNLDYQNKKQNLDHFTGVNYNNLINIPLIETLRNRQDVNVTSKLKGKQTCLGFACVNARSLRNKTTDVVDYITSSNTDICIFTETWLKDIDLVTFVALSPDGYHFESSPREEDRIGGGIGIMYRSMISIKRIHANQFRSFEFAEWNATIQNQVLKLIAVYRPPSCPVGLFFDEFSIYLESIIPTTERLLISGDFNFHFESSEDINTKKFCDILETFGLIQHVAFPTHISGHTLDLVTSRSINDVIITELESTLALSDHTTIECKLDLPKPNFTVKEFRFRQLKRIDIPLFKQDICLSEL